MKATDLLKFQLLILLSATVAFATSAQTASKAQTNSEIRFVETGLPKFKGGSEALEKIIQQHLLPLQTTDEADSDARLILSFLVAPDGKVTNISSVRSGFTYKKHQTPDGKYDVRQPSKNERLRKAATAALEATSGLWIVSSPNQASIKLAFHTTFNGNDAPTGEIKPFTDTKESKVYKQADQMPQYKSGNNALMQDFNKSLHIHEDAKRENLSAKIITSFIVEVDGSISNVKLLDTKYKKMVGPGATLDYMDASTFNIQNKTILAKLSEAAIQALKETSGKWEAGKISGRSVRVEMVLPITFTSSNPSRTIFEAPATALQSGKTSPSTLPQPFAYVQEMPRYKTGDAALAKFLAANLQYPEVSEKSKTQDMVVIGFVVEENGQLGNIHVLKGLSPELDREALRVLHLTKDDWLPGKQGGIPVRVKYTLPIIFK